jgi:hypothetical protein
MPRTQDADGPIRPASIVRWEQAVLKAPATGLVKDADVLGAGERRTCRR